jgi:general secretion pathway protein H
MREVAGFTLLELLVVLAVLAATASVVGPRLSSGGGGGALRGARTAIVEQLVDAREAAIRDGKPRCRSLPTSAVRGCEPLRVQGAALDSHATALRFFADGSSTGGSIRVQAGKTSGSVSVIAATGEIVTR